MRHWLPTLLALSVAAYGADSDEQPKKKLPGSTLLPDGSELHGVVIPRHNEKYELENSLMADLVTLVNDEMISGERVTIDFFGKGGKRTARIKLKQATFNQTAGMLHATEKVTIDAETYRAEGTGLHYALRSNTGLLIGPTTSWISNPPKETAMKPKTPALIAATGIMLVGQTQPAPAQDPAGAADRQPVKVNTVTENPISEARKEAQVELQKQIEASETTDAEVKDFVERIPMDYEQLTGAKPTPAPDKPLEVNPKPADTIVKCKGGMYFDAKQGQLVYLKEVRVDDPQYILTGADVLRIYMKKKPEPPKNEKDKKDGKKTDANQPANAENAGAPKPTPQDKPKDADAKPKEKKDGPVPAMGGDFDSVEKIVATGAVRILQKAVEKGKDPVEASGAYFTYNPETGDILLSGGYPWVKQGDFYARAQQPNLTLRMKKDGSFVTEGHWEMGMPNKKKPEKSEKPKNRERNSDNN